MSLVNDMLRDLEHRRSDAPAVEIAFMKSNTVAVRPNKIFVAVLLVVLVLAAIFWVVYGQQFTASLPAPVPTPTPAPAVIKAPINNQAVENSFLTTNAAPQAQEQVQEQQVQLENLTQETADNGFVLRLQFNAAVKYTTESKSNYLRLRFAGVQQSGNFNLPNIPAEFAILQLLDEGDALVLTLQTRSAVSYQLRRIDQQTLVIILSGLQPEASSAGDQVTGAVAVGADATASLAPSLAEEANEKPPVAMNDVVDIKQPRELSPAQRDKQIARQAKNDLRSGNRQVAREDLSGYVEQYPEYARESGYLLASMMLENREQNAAIFLIKNLRKELPDDVPLRQLQAQAMIANDQVPQAVKFLQEISPPINTYSSYYEVLAAAAQKSGDPVMAAKIYERLLSVDRQRGDWWMGFAIAADTSNQKDRATQAFARALSDPQLTPALRQYAKQRLGMPVN